MKAVFIDRYGAPDVLSARETAEPEPGKGQVRVRVRAAGVNFADLLMRQGLYAGAPKNPFVPGYEVAGEVETLGEGVTGWTSGQRVYAALGFGGYAEKVCLPAAQLCPLPEGRTFEEGAALPVNYLTAWRSLFRSGNLREGGTVLCHAAAGGVGMAALELSNLQKARFIGAASSGKHGFLQAHGAFASVDPAKEDLRARVKELTGGRGVDVAIDGRGGRGFRESYDCLGIGGVLVCLGVSAASPGPGKRGLQALWTFATSGFFSPLSMMLENRGVAGVHLGRMSAEELRPDMEKIHSLFAAGHLQPHVGAVFPLEKAAEAHAHIHSRKSVGKVILTC